MKSKNTPVTLQAIGDLIDEKLDQKLKFTNTKIIGIYGELDGLKQQILIVNNNLEAKVEAHRKETEDGFNAVFDGLEELGRNIDRNLEPRIRRLETKAFAN